ncbi:MAG: IS21 family transposase [Acidobacteria bacterium]|nr:IS21 family transposase [Acidobacteriota bacterium]
MTRDQQVRRLMSLIKKGLPLATAAAKSGMSEPTARKYRRKAKLPSQLRKDHDWRTRPDPFTEVWPEIQQLLERDAGLQAKTVFHELQRRYPDRFPQGQLRTLQRRFRDWRALNGPDKEVFFPQVHIPGEQCQSDFTSMNALEITIAGVPLKHLVYHFVLPYSNWEHVTICYSESFESLSQGLQEALWTLGAVPFVHRTDNLSAATHELIMSRGRGFTARYIELLNHYGMEPSKNFPGNAHENGDVEQSHFRFRDAVDQRLRLLGIREFSSLSEYTNFLRSIAEERNVSRKNALSQELEHMRPLPVRRMDAFRELDVTVARSSVVRILHNAYSVPSRLIGHRLRARIFADEIELYYRGCVVERLERIRGNDNYRIDYRHIVYSLVRKPGAFQRFVYREAMFPTLNFRKAYDSLKEKSTKWADLEYLRILHLAARTLESRVEAAIEKLLAEGRVPEYEAVRSIADLVEEIPWPKVQIQQPDLTVYDQLIA